MSSYSLGFLFFPLSRPIATNNVEILRRSLETLGGIQQVRDISVFRTDEDIHALSYEQACKLLGQHEQGGRITIDIAGFNTDLWFTPSSIQSEAGYQYLRIEIPYREVANIKGDPMRIELFAAAWVRLCEVLQAQAAYFDHINMGRIEDIALSRIRKLRQGNFWEFTRTRYWRAYLDPAAAGRWHEQNQQAAWQWDERIETLPSGALVLSLKDRYNPELGDDDAIFNARFLIQQLTQRPDIAGVESLLEQLSLEEKRLIRIEDDADYTKHGSDAEMDYEGLAESRAILDDIRATWACALEQRGLVGVMQTFTEEARREPVLVPVFADEGREWVIATLLYPFDLDTSAWNDPQNGLQARVQTLLDTAQRHPIDSEPPRVIVYFWRGVSDEVREALTAMGASVEVADHLPLLA